ncbi:MAG TPA: DUF6629 family protein [Acidimicrobiales bacterium]|nr:DUF6629 family protein [Acidimicrobiales bacterium]
MCFSPQADLVGGAVVAALGVDAIRHVHRHHGHVAIAALPLVLGAHQLDESLVWWGLQGHVSASVGRVAMWVYLSIAFVLLPIYVPAAVLALERSARRRWAMAPFVVLGAGVSAALLAAMIHGPVHVRLAPYHLSYGMRLGDGGLVVVLYVVAVCGALLCSSERPVVLFGVVNLVAIAVIAVLTVDGFTSVWCGWAAVSSGAIVVYLRVAARARRRRAVGELRSATT